MNKDFIDIKTSKSPVSEKDVVEFVLDLFYKVKKSKKIRHLVDFQAMNKYMLMAHNQEELKMLGNLVASCKKNSMTNIFEKYEKHLKIALKKEPTTNTHYNVLLHIFGYFSKHFNQHEKDLFYELLQQFKNQQIPIGKTLAEINPLVFRFNNTYLAQQTYFLLYADTRPGILFAVFNPTN